MRATRGNEEEDQTHSKLPNAVKVYDANGDLF